ncbi:Predicted ATPase [Thiothrix eikelboomii]|uniref:Predicted ATPase n=1 Tax=Thiothrix eikelboomii TaxID=92487 RepID=A0A1T4WXA5_9GAMM|nr:AAA family ATPase [Thiothrix eikelboomii]SKA81993.1 Predicted ATPase [Thiothrix eikelboomii]
MPPSIRFDPSNQTLLTEHGTIQLPPKAFGILTYLCQHPQQLVTKEELLTAVWPGVFVTDAVLKVTIGELRKALADDAKDPRFIETVHRRGYRFIGELPELEAVQAHTLPHASSVPTLESKLNTQPALLGRVSELAQLHKAWEDSLAGHKQSILVQAEAGFGKTTLLNHWLASLPTQQVVVKVQCLDQYGQTEAYQPFVDALIELVTGTQHNLVLSHLKQYAPIWLAQLPPAYQPSHEVKLAEPFGATTGRMLREFADFIEQLSKQLPLIWVIEDVHWSDAASIELLATLIQRQQPARLLLISSLRPSHLQQQTRLKSLLGELAAAQKCQTLDLMALNSADLAAYLTEQLPPALNPAWAVELFQRYTEGNPLFVFTALEHIKKSSAYLELAEITPTWLEQAISGGLKTLLAFKFASLHPKETQLLQAASIAISRSTSEGCAAILEQDVLSLEDDYEQLLLKEFWLISSGEYVWPDGSIGESYRFRHKIYQEFIYTTLSAARRRHYHLRLAKRLQAAYQERSAEIAAKLAYHFEQGGDLSQAIHCLQQASRVASQRFAYHEALQQLEHIIELTQIQTKDGLATLDWLEQRCNLLLASGQLALAIPAYQTLIAASETQSNQHTVRGLLGLAGALFWVNRQQCLVTGQGAVALSETLGDAALTTHARGKLAHWRSIIEGYRPEYREDYESAMRLAQQTNDPTLKCTHFLLYIYYLIITSNYQQATEIALETQQLAKAAGDANSYLGSIFFQAWSYFYLGQWSEMASLIKEALALAEKNAQIHWVTHFQLQQAWLLIHTQDYQQAASLVEPIHQQQQLAPFKTSAYFFSIIILIHLKTKQAELNQAQNYINTINAYLLDDAQAIDWILKLPLYQGIAEFYLKTQQIELALAAAQQLDLLAQQSQEASYIQLAKRLSMACLQVLGKTTDI